ncbi:hypothetical protein [Maribacter sp.]|uniref:hypothetical protein n=1 Tax=Maribacter sp. TaxID=1897614 RepID=UPI003299F349
MKTIENLKALIKAKSIGNIFFILSSDNKIILDAMGTQFFRETTGLEELYTKIEEQKSCSRCWDNNHSKNLLFSYYLNYKIKELSNDLSQMCFQSVSIKGKIYKQNEHKFYPIYSNLICQEKFHFN